MHDTKLDAVLDHHRTKIQDKTFIQHAVGSDPLMEAFGVTETQKRLNMQVWGQRLGMCWEDMVISTCSQFAAEYRERLRTGRRELCDLVIGTDAIDTKYRIGSGDGATVRKFVDNGYRLRDLGYEPIMLIVREDSLDGTIHQCEKSWTIIDGIAAFDYVEDVSGFDLLGYLQSRKVEKGT